MQILQCAAFFTNTYITCYIHICIICICSYFARIKIPRIKTMHQLRKQIQQHHFFTRYPTCRILLPPCSTHLYICMYGYVWSTNKPASPTFLLFIRLPLNRLIQTATLSQLWKNASKWNRIKSQQNRCVYLARTTNQTNRLPAALMNDCLAICMHNTHTHTHIHTHIHLYVEYLCTCSTVALSLFILPLFDCDTHANATYPSSRVCASLHCC